MGKVLILVAVVIACAGCSSIPAKSSTLMANYHKLIVRDINWKETATSEIPPDQMKEFIASQSELEGVFRAVFDRYVREIGYFDTIAYGSAQADSDTLVLIPKIYTLKPSGFMPGASYTGLLMSADGKLIGKYTEERRLSSSSSSPDKIKENAKKLIMELAEDAASRLPYAR